MHCTRFVVYEKRHIVAVGLGDNIWALVQGVKFRVLKLLIR